MIFSIVFLSTGALWDGCYPLPLRHFPNNILATPLWGGHSHYQTRLWRRWSSCMEGIMIDEIAFNFEHELKLEPIDQQQFIGTDQIQHTANTLPEFNFRKTSLSRPAREQLAEIYKSVLAGGEAASKRSGLRNLILTNIFNPVIGVIFRSVRTPIRQ